MSQEQESIELEEKTARRYAGESKNTGNTLSAFLLILVFMMLCICTVLLVLVVNLNKEVGNINIKLMALQEANRYMELEEEELESVSDINGSNVDQTEAAHIVEAAAIENKVVWDGNTDTSSGIKRVYLTFDDGPSENTAKILDILDKYNANVTF